MSKKQVMASQAERRTSSNFGVTVTEEAQAPPKSKIGPETGLWTYSLVGFVRF